MALQFTVRDAQGRIVTDLAQSLTKVLGSFSVNSSRTVFVPELVGERGWAIVRGLNWNAQTGSPNICIADVVGGNINIQLTYGTYEIVYGTY